MKCEQKVPYPSELLATNAAWLHRAAYPDCGGINVYPCLEPDCGHFHIGHPTKSIGAACAATKKPALWRPARWSRGHRHPSRRMAAR